MKMDYIREFVILGRCLNFTKASAELFLSQTTLSRHIAMMEKELGLRLLQRDSHSVALTQAGQSTLEVFRNISEQYERYLKQMERLKQGACGRLCIAECYYAVDRYLSEPLRHFRQQFPQVEVELLAFQPYEVEQAVLEGRADLGMTILYGEWRSERLDCLEICRESCFCCMPSDHPLARRKKIRFSDLNGETLLTSYNESSYRAFVESLLEKYDVHPKRWVYGGQADAMNANILSEQAITIMPEHLKDIPHRGITYVPIDASDCTATIAYIWRRDNQTSTVKLFLNEQKAY